MDYDLRTCQKACDFILEFMNMTSNEYIDEFAIECESDFEKFWERNIDRIKKVDISKLYIIAFHVIGTLDNCKEIKEKGLMNLQEVLSKNTLLCKLLKSYGIEFDITKKTMSHNEMIYNIDYDKYRSKLLLTEKEKNIRNVARRVYYDFCVNGFLFNDNIFDYGTDIHKRPEFLMTLSSLLPEVKKLERYWENNSKSYRIDFYAKIDQIQRFCFALDELKNPPYEGWEKLNDEMKIKKWMLLHAIDRSNNVINEDYLYVKDDVIIPPSQILKISKLEKIS
ncbi:hypothetical protein [Thomasclavelia spiroformis]|uniref:hypothetical protein n=1 Tax=Thomasclavelia spiroformis TaxID=29348 RepID=UPI0039954481